MCLVVELRGTSVRQDTGPDSRDAGEQCLLPNEIFLGRHGVPGEITLIEKWEI